MTIPFLIIGQGLAGSLLAWKLMQSEQRVLLVDSVRENSASRIAAGLVNPITGQRLVKAEDVDQCLSSAMACYTGLQQAFDHPFYYPKPMLRLFGSQADKDRYLNRCRDPKYREYLGEEFAPGQSGEPIDSNRGGFKQQQTGYLDIPALLDTLRRYFKEHKALVDARFNYQDLELLNDQVRWQGQQVESVIFCDGAQAIDNPWFRWLPFQLSKGEIITVRSSARLPEAIINDGYWLLPYESKVARSGATYDWEWMSEGPTQDARQQLLDACHRITGDDSELELIDHRAGVRPTTRDKSPFLGAHPEHPALHIFNGFGSKGSLLIPYYVDCMANYFLGDKPLPDKADIARFDNGKSIVTVTRRYLSEHIQPGDVVVDATVGNGHDTEFVARCVGSSGRVFGMDIQQQAIDNTYRRLSYSGLSERVTLMKSNHEQLNHGIPPQFQGYISAIVFNLGYLPGNNKQVVTFAKTTIAALKQSLSLIKTDGMLSIVCYRGHDEGVREAGVLQDWLTTLDTNYFNIVVIDPDKASKSPFLVMVRKLA